MQDFINYVVNNKEWIFSGVGVVFITLIIKFLFFGKGRSGNINKVKNKGNNNTTTINN